MGTQGNKVYLPMLGRSVLGRTLSALEASGGLNGLVVVHGDGERELAQMACAGLTLPYRLVAGGERRQDSVLAGLRMLPSDCEIVAIQDGARPFPTGELICACLKSAREYGSGVAASAVRDTIKLATQENVVVSTPLREDLRAVKTPQAFRLGELLEAYERSDRENWQATDDAQIYEMAGHPVHLVPCGEDNIKITTPEDLPIAQALLGGNGPLWRTGMGYDVHRLVQGRKLILCGVEIPHELGLDGHSDADVALHALTDALLGACALGDIGRLFPDTDAQYKDADSAVLLASALKLIGSRGFEPWQIDVTIMAQAPKIAPWIDKMTSRLSQITGLLPAQINVKATTTEHLGFVGRKEGIAAQAVAMVRQL